MADEFYLLRVLPTHVELSIGNRSEIISESIVGFYRDRENTSVSVLVVKIQGDFPRCTLQTSCFRGEVHLAEGERRSGSVGVVNTARHGVSLPVGWTFNFPVGIERLYGVRCIIENNLFIALQVHGRVFSSGRIQGGSVTIERDVRT